MYKQHKVSTFLQLLIPIFLSNVTPMTHCAYYQHLHNHTNPLKRERERERERERVNECMNELVSNE